MKGLYIQGEKGCGKNKEIIIAYQETILATQLKLCVANRPIKNLDAKIQLAASALDKTVV